MCEDYELMERIYEIDGKEYEVTYNEDMKTVKSIKPKDEYSNIINNINPADFKLIEDENKYNGVNVKLVAEFSGLIATERMERLYKVEFIQNNEVIKTICELVVLPQMDEYDFEKADFYLVDENNQKHENYNYGEREEIAHKYYWDNCDLFYVYNSLCPGETKIFKEDGYLTIKITCLDLQTLTIIEESIIL